MDKNNRKLKIKYKYIKANTSAISQHNICCTYHQLKYPSPNSWEKKKRHTKELTFRKKKDLGKKMSGDWAKSKKG